ncbi:MAG: HD-GYP domain-containing protein [Phycisphaeraceae bacterium]
MNTTATYLAPLALPDRLLQRLEALGLTVLCVAADGRCRPQGECRWIERVLVDAAPFAAAVQSAFAQLCETRGRCVEVWPGVWLLPLPSHRRRRLPTNKEQQVVYATIVLGGELAISDQFRLLCDSAQLDAQVTASRLARERLCSAAEADRLAATLDWMQQDTQEIDRRCSELQTLSQQLGESYEELSLLYKFSTSMTLNQPPATFLTDACLDLQQVVGLRWMALQLVDDEPRLNELAGQIFTAGPVGCDEQLLKRIGGMLMARQSPGAAPLVVDDTQSLAMPHLNRIAKQLLVVPLAREDKLLGILFGGDKTQGVHISSVDSKLCNSLANSLAMFLENMMLYEDMAAMFMGVLHALTASIDAKDRYTRGHSERVALLSRQLAAGAGLDEHTVERVYISALVHDVGKIGVPESVLCKPGRLTEEEFAQIRKHPEIGATILHDIRQMQDLIPGVLHHHERWDGHGYPHLLAGNDIPLFGRLICLADSFDAMSSNRTYRSSLSQDSVLDEVRRCTGTQFDPHLAQVFLDLDFAQFHQMLKKHQDQLESDGGDPW